MKLSQNSPQGMANTGYAYGSYLSKSLRDQSSSTLVMTDGVWERFFDYDGSGTIPTTPLQYRPTHHFSGFFVFHSNSSRVICLPGM